MFIKKAALALIFCLAPGSCFLFSCNQKPEPGGKMPEPVYFNVQAYLLNQIRYLESINPPVQKTVANGALPPEQATVSQVNWEKELAFFLEADINKDAWRNTYQGDTIANPATGTYLYSYRNLATAKAPVKLIQVETRGHNRVISIRLVTRQQNPLFFAGRTLTLICNPTVPGNRIEAYTITGVQKPFFADSLTYSVTGTILY